MKEKDKENSGSIELLEKVENAEVEKVNSQPEEDKKTTKKNKKLKQNNLEKEKNKETEQKPPENNQETEQKKQEKEEPVKEKVEIKTLEEAKKEDKKENEVEVEKKHTKTNVILIAIGIIVVIIAILSTIFAVINLGSDKIMKGVYIKEIDVSGMTRQEAEETLKEKYALTEEDQIYLTYEEFETAITYQALEVNYQIEKAINEAYAIGRKGNVFEENIEIVKTWMTPVNIKLDISIDEDMVKQISQNINNSIKDAVVQSSYYIEGKNLIITSGKEGKIVNADGLIEKIYNSLEEESNGKVTIPVITAQPKKIDLEKIHQEIYKEVQNAYYTTDPFTIYPESEGIDFDVENAKTIISEAKEEYIIPLKITKPTKTVRDIGTAAFPDRLGSCSTKYSSNADRTTNLKLAANKINGVVLLPGQEFSYNQTVGERTIQAGYKEAATFSNGEVVNGLGGGICQISSTLYDAVVYANLDVTVRRNHQFVTSYLPAGKDATVVWGSQDFKFKNTRKYPIRIEAIVSGGMATINIWGIKEEVEYDISIETRKIATINPTTQYIQDPTLPVGKEVVKQAGSNGRKVEAYKVMKKDGKVVSSTLLSRDTYNAKKRIVRVGTGEQQ